MLCGLSTLRCLYQHTRGSVFLPMEDRSLFERNKSYTNKVLKPDEWQYFNAGSDREETIRNNETAFRNILLRPHLLSNDPQNGIDLGTNLLGTKVDFPIGISPTAYHQIMHPDGEIATARAADAMRTVYVQSLFSSAKVEDVSSTFPGLAKWLQVRSYRERGILAGVIRRAEKSGYTALVVTVDSPVKRLAPLTLPQHIRTANLPLSPPGTPAAKMTLNPIPVTWKEVEWIKSISKLPIVLKGILTAEDARLALEHGVAAIQVSNHGGRQLDCSPATIEALVEISEAVGGEIDIFLDGGVRCGADVLKALALGAKAVFLGKPIVYGLCYNGSDGVQEVLNEMKEQLILAMKLTGCTNVKNIPLHIIRRKFICKI